MAAYLKQLILHGTPSGAATRTTCAAFIAYADGLGQGTCTVVARELQTTTINLLSGIRRQTNIETTRVWMGVTKIEVATWPNADTEDGEE